MNYAKNVKKITLNGLKTSKKIVFFGTEGDILRFTRIFQIGQLQMKVSETYMIDFGKKWTNNFML